MGQFRRIALILSATGLLLPGCVSMGLTQSAQALPPGATQHSIGVEWFRVYAPDSDYNVLAPIPFYGVRAGVAEQVDFGVKANVTFTSVSLDLKVQLLDSEAIDLAIDPTLQASWIVGWAHLPLLLGINLSERFQITLSGRAVYLFPLLEDDTSDIEDALGTSTDQFMVGGGIGIYAQLGSSLGIAPEIQVMRGTGDADRTLLSLVIGLTFGDQPGRTKSIAKPLPSTIPPTMASPPPAQAPVPPPQAPVAPPTQAPAVPGPDGVPDVPPGYGGSPTP